jgi:hypothetical protein
LAKALGVGASMSISTIFPRVIVKPNTTRGRPPGAHRAPNPLGLHRVTVRAISGTRLRIGPIEAIDGTPVVDVKPVLVDCADV